MSMLLAEAASITGSKNADPRSILSFFVNSIYLLVWRLTIGNVLKTCLDYTYDTITIISLMQTCVLNSYNIIC